MAEEKFHLVSSYAPTGDQPQAIAQLVEGVERGDRCQTLLGVTGSGKTFTMANVIAQCNRPTLVLAHNKTLAAQLCTEFRSFFPDNAVEYFVSYYDYYQPEAYIPAPIPISKRTALSRRDRPPAPLGYGSAVRAAGRHNRRVGVLHLLAGRPHRLSQHGHQPAARDADGAGRAVRKAGDAAI